MQSTRRSKRLALQIQQEISMLLLRGLKDPRIGLVTITGVELSPDLRHARVFVSVMGSDKQQGDSMRALAHASGWIRRELGTRIRMKFLPEIEFRIDTSQEYGERIEQLLRGLQGNRNA